VTPRKRLAISLVALAVSSSSPSAAQQSSAEAALAIQLFDDAEKLMTSGNPAAACPKYAESQRRDPQLGTLLHLADCHEKVGKIASAWAGFKEAAEIAARRNAAGGNERREQVARGRAAALEPKLSRIVIHVAQADVAGLEIRQDGEVLGRMVWGSAIPVDPGGYTFRAQAPGKKPWTQTVEVRAAGGHIEVMVPPLEDEGGAPSVGATAGHARPADVAAAPASDQEGRGTLQRAGGYVITGLGVIGVGIGAAFGLTVLSQLEERDAICRSGTCTPDEASRITDIEARAQSNATVSTLALALGGAAMLGGVALVLTSPSTPSRSVMALKVSPWVGPHAAGAYVGGRW
jgi:hypothetical protein